MFFRVAYYIAALAPIFRHNAILPVKGQSTVQRCENSDSSMSLVEEIQQMFVEFHERLQAIERHLQKQNIYTKQIRSVHALLNSSHQESNTQHDAVLKRFEAIDRRLRDLDIAIKNETENSWKLAIAVGVDLERDPVPPIINNWIIIMHRFNGSLNFNRSWIEYRNGFGNASEGEFWLGNEQIHRLTNRFLYTLRIEVQYKANSAWYFADYSAFSLDSENNKYALRLSGCIGGNAGDSLTAQSMDSRWHLGGMSFSTWDSDNDRNNGGNCASSFGGGWWFNNCHQSCLTCQYISSFFWFSSYHVSSGVKLRAARLMINRK